MHLSTYTFEERRKLANAQSEIKEMFYCFQQGKHLFLQQYHDLFQGQVVVLDEVGVTIPDEILLVESVWLCPARRTYLLLLHICRAIVNLPVHTAREY